MATPIAVISNYPQGESDLTELEVTAVNPLDYQAYRWKIGPTSQIDCTIEAGYSDEISHINRPSRDSRKICRMVVLQSVPSLKTMVASGSHFRHQQLYDGQKRCQKSYKSIDYLS